MKVLTDVVVLLVSDALEELDLLLLWVRSEGAKLLTSSSAAADEVLAREAPGVVVLDMRREPQAGYAQLARIRAQPVHARLPAIGLVERSDSSAALQAGTLARFEKLIATPLHPADLISALAGLKAATAEKGALAEPAAAKPARASAPAEASSRAAVLGGFLKRHAEKQDMRGLLQLLNATGPFRYTSILRIDGDQLSSVWTFDREAPDADSFPVDKAVGESYCALVLQADAPVSIPDATADSSLGAHPARHTVLSYCGVPLRRDDASFFGTLCHFDVAPRLFAESTVKRLEETALLLREHLPASALREPPSSH